MDGFTLLDVRSVSLLPTQCQPGKVNNWAVLDFVSAYFYVEFATSIQELNKLVNGLVLILSLKQAIVNLSDYIKVG